MRRLDAIGRRGASEERFDLSGLSQALNAGLGYGIPLLDLSTTYGKTEIEPVAGSYQTYVQGAYKSNGVVFACILARMLLFSEIRFAFQQFNNGKPSSLFSTADLAVLERPWTNATTGDLMVRWEQHASLAGNAYAYRSPRTGSLRVLRPDWVDILVGSPDDDPFSLDAHVAGYLYRPGGSDKKAVTLLPENVAHYAPIPDPAGQFRGMSWITSIVTEVEADSMATAHKRKFFENGATPNLAVKYPKELTAEQVKQFASLINGEHKGWQNAYKTMHIGGGADPVAIGTNFQQLEFKITQGHGETRVAAAAGVPPIVVGLSEGLEASTYSNYGQARRKFADGWARPHWRMAAGALESIVPPPSTGARLWYDASDVSFLQEDEKDAAAILAQQAQTIRTLTDAGYTPDSVKAAVDAGDLNLLTHSGLYSVQLQAPGTGQAPPA